VQLARSVSVRDRDQTTRVGERQRTQDGGVDQPEQGRVRADAECHGEDSHRRETWILTQLANGVAEIAQ
jgi:hypothetical protein